MESKKLKGMVAIITGGADGIGKASAKILGENGCNIAIGDLNLEKAIETANEIKEKNPEIEVIALHCDVTKEDNINSFFNQVIEKFGKVNILINNAGGGGGGRENLLTMSREYIEKIYALNVFSVFSFMRLCAPYMKKDGYGSIINISSMASNMTSYNMSVYGSSKAAINRLTKYAALDLGPEIRVNAIGPGAIKTKALESVLTPEIQEQMLKNTPIKRLGEPEDIANLVYFLASPSSSWISGEIIYVNGGGIQSLG